MLRGRSVEGDAGVVFNRGNTPKLRASGGITGFLVAPGMMASTRMPILYAIGASLLAVTVFGLTTALNYAQSGLVDWTLTGVFIAGGVLGGLVGR